MKIKSLVAITAGKIGYMGIKMLKRQGSHTPGAIAEKIDASILKTIPKPSKIMAVTGTNGKTTTANLIIDLLKTMNIETMNNQKGSNIGPGVKTPFVLNYNPITKKNKYDVGVLEVDELWSTYLLPDIKPDSLTVVNFFQDSYERNAYPDFIFNRVKKGITHPLTLILNALDPISNRLDVPSVKKIFFLVDNIFNVESNKYSNIEGFHYCPNCHHQITYDFKFYHQMGLYHCDQCGYKNPEANYRVVHYNEDTNRLNILINGEPFEMKCLYPQIETVMNQIAVVATLCENGYDPKQVCLGFDHIHINETRFKAVDALGSQIISFAAKGYNPIAPSRIYQAISKYSGKNVVVMLLDNLEEKQMPDKLSSWILGLDFHYLSNVSQIIVKSRFFGYQFLVGLTLSGFDMSKVSLVSSEEEILEVMDTVQVDHYFVLHDIERENQQQKDRVIENIKKKIEAKL